MCRTIYWTCCCEPSVLTYNIVMKCLCTQRRMDEATTLISLMGSRGFRPDMFTNSIVVTAHCNIGDMGVCLVYLMKWSKDGQEPFVAVFDSILHACVEWGALSKVVSMPDDQSWTGT